MTKQTQILNYLRTVKMATVEMIYANVDFDYSQNPRANMKADLDLMISSGLIEKCNKIQYRIKKVEVNNTLNLGL